MVPRHRAGCSVFSLALVLLTAATATPASAVSYSFETFDFPGAAPRTRFWDANSAGEIVGNYTDFVGGSNVQGAFVLRGGVYTELAFPGASSTSAFGINASGRIAGTASFPQADGSRRQLGFVLDSAGYRSIEPVPGKRTIARDIADSGVAVGAHSLSTSPQAFADPGGDIALPVSDVADSQAWGISESGWVGGFFEIETERRGFLLRQGSGGDADEFIEIESPSGRPSLSVLGVGPNGEGVGSYATGIPSMSTMGFVFAEGRLSPLSVPGARNTEITGIGADGSLVGSYTDAFGVFHGFVATPLPEIGSLSSLLLGLLALGLWLRSEPKDPLRSRGLPPK